MKIARSKIFFMALAAAFTGATARAWSQTKVTLDNYYNHETDPKTGGLFHYLWSDEANSGFSEWGKLFLSKGAVLDTLQRAPSAADLSHSDVYIIADPDTKAESPAPHYVMNRDVKAVADWVRNGGVLVLMSNDSGNCEFTHFNQLAAAFGLHFNEDRAYHVIGRDWNMGAITDLPNYPVFTWVKKIYVKDVSTLRVSGPAHGVLVKNGLVIIAESHVGKGYVFAIGDPWIYNEYIGHRYLPADFQNHLAAENLSGYLISLSHRARSGK